VHKYCYNVSVTISITFAVTVSHLVLITWS